MNPIDFTRPAEELAKEAISYYKDKCYPNYNSNPELFEIYEKRSRELSAELAIHQYEAMLRVCPWRSAPSKNQTHFKIKEVIQILINIKKTT